MLGTICLYEGRFGSQFGDHFGLIWDAFWDDFGPIRRIFHASLAPSVTDWGDHGLIPYAYVIGQGRRDREAFTIRRPWLASLEIMVKVRP